MFCSAILMLSKFFHQDLGLPFRANFTFTPLLFTENEGDTFAACAALSGGEFADLFGADEEVRNK